MTDAVSRRVDVFGNAKYCGVQDLVIVQDSWDGFGSYRPPSWTHQMRILNLRACFVRTELSVCKCKTLYKFIRLVEY